MSRENKGIPEKFNEMGSNEYQKNKSEEKYREWIKLRDQTLNLSSLRERNYFEGIFFQINCIVDSYKNIAEDKIEKNEILQNELKDLKCKKENLEAEFEEKNKRISELEQANKELKKEIFESIVAGRRDVMKELLEHFSTMENIRLDFNDCERLKRKMQLEYTRLFARLKENLSIECYQHERKEKISDNDENVLIKHYQYGNDKDLDNTVYESLKTGCKIGNSIIKEEVVLYRYEENVAVGDGKSTSEAPIINESQDFNDLKDDTSIKNVDNLDSLVREE